MIHLPALIRDLALILSVAALVTLIFKKLKQPVVLGYIIAGLLVSPNFKLFPTVFAIESIKTWADIGVIFLLFGLGLEFSFKKLIKVGGVAAITAFTEVTLTLLLGFGVGKLMGWKSMDCLFLGGILAIASTTIIIRAFDELGVKNHKFAGIVTGVLVIEDLVAVLLMVLLSTVAVSQSFAGVEMLTAVLKLAFFLVLWFVAGIFFIPTIFKMLKRLLNDETILILSLAFCFIMVVLATYVGFSPALGAFIMGSILAETTKAEKIEQLTGSVKTLFGAIFFVSVGMLIEPDMLLKYAGPIIAATLVLLIGKPIFVTLGALVSGQSLKISVQSGMSLSQIGEFSFIIAALGLNLKVTSDFLYPVAVAVSVLTTFTTPYMIRLSEPFYKWLDAVLPEKWKTLLTKYSIGTINVSETSDWSNVLKSYFFNVIIFSVIIFTLIFLSTQYLSPFLFGHEWSRIVTAVVTLTVLAPFLWALAFRRTQRQAYANLWLQTDHRGPLLVLQFSRMALAVLFIGLFFRRMFSPWMAFWGIITTCILLLLMSKKIRAFYGKIELRFLTNFNERESASASSEILAPWDTHITKFLLTAQSPCVGKPLAETKMREKFGVNIVMIERGDYGISLPKRENHLYPNDKVSVIGTDEQLHNFKAYLESTAEEPTVENEAKQTVSLHHFNIGRNFSFVGLTIRESRIRERTKGLVVGIERNGKRIINPESNEVFKANDTVWIVGEDKQILSVIKKISTQL
jgi:monovalent cation:H+ antiporter-2, CPA2 family